MSSPAMQALIVAVTGHTDLVDDELDGIRALVGSFFTELRDRYPDLDIHLVSPLADGADLLAAEVALEMSIDLIVPLPMPETDYLADFRSREAIQRYHDSREAASTVFELPSPGSGAVRDERYARLGVFLVSHCHVLLAIWDGKQSLKTGGTSEVVRFHRDSVMSGYTSGLAINRQMLVDDESDLVHHIVCSRDRPDGQPEEGFVALQSSWYSKDEDLPRAATMPPQHDVVFQRANDFSRDTRRFADHIEAESLSLMPDDASEAPTMESLDSTYRAADWLATYFQKKTLRTLRIMHLLAFLMGTLFVVYSDLDARRPLLYLFLLCFVVALVVQATSVRHAWHRKYLDYRALAEGLRVHYYWKMAGIAPDSYDNFLQLQDPEIGWIRNTMRTVGLFVRGTAQDPQSLQQIFREWVGDECSGQLGYYRKKLAERVRRHRITESLGRVSLATSASVLLALVIAGDLLPESWFDPLMVMMGITLLLFGVRHAYAHAIAENDLIKQYDFMLRIFRNANKRLQAAGDDSERRGILLSLGGAALDEHAQWILMHRERSVKQSEIWRIGSGS